MFASQSSEETCSPWRPDTTFAAEANRAVSRLFIASQRYPVNNALSFLAKLFFGLVEKLMQQFNAFLPAKENLHATVITNEIWFFGLTDSQVEFLSTQEAGIKCHRLISNVNVMISSESGDSI